jgi:hypothetical protein
MLRDDRHEEPLCSVLLSTLGGRTATEMDGAYAATRDWTKAGSSGCAILV